MDSRLSPLSRRHSSGVVALHLVTELCGMTEVWWQLMKDLGAGSGIGPKAHKWLTVFGMDKREAQACSACFAVCFLAKGEI